MKRLLVLGPWLLFMVSASAQYGPPRGGRNNDRGGAYDNRGGVFDRVRGDLDRAEGSSYANGGDRRKFNKVREELNEFQRSGHRGELNDAISALQKVVNSNRLAYRDREVLNQDLYLLRDFRARQGWH